MAHTDAMPTLPASTTPDRTLVLATAATKAMVTPVPTLTSVLLAPTAVMPTLRAPTRSEDTLAHATTDTLATETVVWQIQLRLRHRMSMSVLTTPIIVMQMQRARTLRDHSRARVTAVTKGMVHPVPMLTSVS